MMEILEKYLNTEEGGQDHIGKYYQVDFIEEASGHQNDEDEVHDGKDAEGDALKSDNIIRSYIF